MKKNLLRCLFFATFVLISSCEQDKALDPRPTIVEGQFMRLDIKNPFIVATNINNTFFGGELTSPSNKVVKYDMFIRYKNTLGVTESNYVFLKSITSFPYDLKITIADLALALGKNVTDLKKGDKFYFSCYSYDDNGTMCNYNSLSSTVRVNKSYKQAYRFVTGIEDSVGPDYNYEAPN